MNYLVIFVPIFLVGAVTTIVMMIRLLYLDSIAREMEKPKLWSAVGAGGNNGSGLLVYLIHRRNYPLKRELT